jgi:hypothetical protein
MTNERQASWYIEDTETGGELEGAELLGAVIHYNPICHSTKGLELLVMNFGLAAWQILVELRDFTGYAVCRLNWQERGGGMRLMSTRTHADAPESQWMRVGRLQ